MNINNIYYCYALYVAMACATANAQERYFPQGYFYQKSLILDDITQRQIVTQLKALREPPIWRPMPPNGDKNKTFRILYLAKDRHPVSVRIERKGGKSTVYAKKHDGWPGIRSTKNGKPVKLILDKSEKMEPAQWNRVWGRLEDAGFWRLPSCVKSSNGIADGDLLLIEAKVGKKYHAILRGGLAAEPSIKKFVRSILIYNSNDAINNWDFFRSADGAAK